ncbi:MULTISPECIES: hypothetical protein [Streptomyces]|uniref:hypothetical protein n=1 Tax=Streptomyces TaxID=1883 RepID=UPI00240E4A1A|nr:MULTISPECIES: hypothetical protein [Streptomyces]WFB82570.1 hypothetical protein MMU79_04150 [Streptomyces olivaceus]WGK44145.1 hypothetical protein M6G09_00210 [Streptomyces sp. B146]
MGPYDKSQGRPWCFWAEAGSGLLLKHKEILVFVNFRIDLPCMSVAFVATLVLGILLVMSPSAQVAALQGEWLLPAVACLLIAGRPAPRAVPGRRSP